MHYAPRIAVAGIILVLPLRMLCGEAVPLQNPSSQDAVIRSPTASAHPRINGPRVFGARPSHPFIYHLPATGQRPLTFTASGMPPGLSLDASTGNITGVANASGTSAVTFTATNSEGCDTAEITFLIGDTICLTPQMGWNSWNHFRDRVSDQTVRAAADAMVSSGLIDHGWTYVNIDDCWEGERDSEGNIHGNKKFPDLKALGEYVHAKGLKFGIYSSPGPRTCGGYAASYQHEDQDARSYAGWGIDYVKYDLCSYSEQVMKARLRKRFGDLFQPSVKAIYESLCAEEDDLKRHRKRAPEQEARLKEVGSRLREMVSQLDQSKTRAYDLEEQQAPYRLFSQSLSKARRDIVYSFCQYGNANVWEWGASLGGNSWRTTGDIEANWNSMSRIGFNQDRLARFAGPGHWNDPDMLEIGNRGLNPDECYTHMTLWCMLSAPLLIGCDMSSMDPFTISLFSNDEVISVDQDSLGRQGERSKVDGKSEVWTKPLSDGSLAVALFNRGEESATVRASWNELGRAPGNDGKPPEARDLWRQKALPSRPDGVAMLVAPHSAELLKVGSSGH